LPSTIENYCYEFSFSWLSRDCIFAASAAARQALVFVSLLIRRRCERLMYMSLTKAACGLCDWIMTGSADSR